MKQTGLTENKVSNVRYFPALDTLRFFAVFGSFLHHSHLIRFIHGHTFFFVLAAFILTLLAQVEYAKTGKFSYKNFLIRRFFRIVPLYLLLLFIGFVCVPYFYSKEVTIPNILPYLTFTANYIKEPHIFLLMILWAVSVIEQFYVFIGFCFRFLYPHLKWIAIAMIVLSVGYKYVLFIENRSIYFDTINHFSTFGMGILLAIGVQEKWFERIRQLSMGIILFVYSAMFIFFYELEVLYSFVWFHALDHVLISLFFSFVILTNTIIPPVVFFFGKSSFLNYIGKISYGLYCYQGLIITFGTLFILPKIPLSFHPIIHVINFSMLILVSHLSYQYFERPFLRFKNKFR